MHSCPGEEQKWAKLQEIDIKKKLSDYLHTQKRPGIEELMDVNAVCPYHGTTLEKIEIDSTGIFVQKCTVCGGIWLSRPDTEKLFHSVKKSDLLLNVTCGKGIVIQACLNARFTVSVTLDCETK